MLKVLLADDEEIICNGLKNGIDWDSLGMELCGTAHDGMEALALIRQESPDLVLTDIRMPFMDGLEMMEKAAREMPKTGFVIISGHDEFSYAQKALTLGAFDYILKPIDIEYLKKKLIQIGDEINQNKVTGKEEENSQNGNIRDFLYKVIFTGMSHDEIYRMMNHTVPSLKKMCCCLINFQLDNYYELTKERDMEDINALQYEFYNIIPENIEYAYFMGGTQKEFTYCLLAENEEQLAAAVDRIDTMRAESTLTVTMGISKTVLRPEDIPRAYHQAANASDYKFIKGAGRRIYISERSAGEEVMPEENYPHEELMRAVRDNKEEEIHRILDDFLEKLPGFHNPKAILTWFTGRVYSKTLNILSDLQISLEEIFDKPYDRYQSIFHEASGRDQVESLKALLIQVSQYITLKQNVHHDQILVKAVNYIKENFTDTSLNMDKAAEMACMSTCYFAVKFKQETGQTFVKYLTGLRINKAKDLLLYTAKKTYEIGEETGYESQSYFSTTFKKQTGMTPSEFRKSFQ